MPDARDVPSTPGERSAPAETPTHALGQLQVMLDAISVPVVRCDRDRRYVWVSRAYARWVGRDVADIVGQRLVDVIGAPAFSRIEPYIERVLAGEQVEYELQVDLPHAGRRWIHSVYTPVFDAGPPADRSTLPDGWVSVIMDVDERRRGEDRLRESHADLQRFAAIVRSSDDTIVSKDLNGIITSWNGAAERMFGYTAEEVIGRSIRLIIPEDRQSEEDHVLARIRRGESIDHFDTLRRRKDGTLVPISLTISPIRDSTGGLIGASKVARDISERHRAEALAHRANVQATFLAQVSAALTGSRDADEMLRMLASFAVPQLADWCAIDLVKDEGRVSRVALTSVDPRLRELSKALRQRSLDLIAVCNPTLTIDKGMPTLIATVTDDMLEAAAHGDAAHLQALRDMRLVSCLCVPMVARDRTFGALTLATGQSGRVFTDDDLRFAQDVASRAALAIESADAYQQLESANRLKDEFLATLSHELRTPLNAVLGYARILRSGTLSGERVAQALTVVERNATALTQIVEDVLDVSRIISGKTRLLVQSVDLARVVNDAVETVGPAADAKGVRIQTLFDSRSGPVSGDPDRLQQVVWNLLSNAVKFTPRGGRVQARVERINSHIEIVVSDTGVGIAPEFLPHLFERFRQADAGPKRRHGGLGLGLAISRHLVEMHGGTLHAASDGEGKGSTFRVKLPLMIVHAETHPEEERVHPRAERPSATSALSDLKGVHVLVVDDDGDALELLREIVEVAGGHATTFNSAVEALQQIDRARPDVLIADIGMPVMDGFDLIARVRQLPDPALRDVPAAALTAYARSEDRAKALRSGFEMHLAKPIDPQEFVAAVEALARRRGAKR